MNISNVEFLTQVFGPYWQSAHVTAFPDDPLAVSKERRGICWGGGWARDRLGAFSPEENQYFTVSLFSPFDDPDRGQRAARRKELFLATYVIVVDDVHEKVPAERAQRLPYPSYRLETSPGNEQWGYLLSAPSWSRDEVDNLLDGLISQGLNPDGTDPGMKGVTRYVRLPEGSNTKTKYVEQLGHPFKCRMLEWRPDLRYTLADLAKGYGVDLYQRREHAPSREMAVADDAHPVLHAASHGLIQITGSDGRGKHDIVCPWVHEHSGQDESGTVIFTNKDGSFGFDCKHGHCADRGAKDVVRYVDDKWPGFADYYQAYKAQAKFAQVQVTSTLASPAAESGPAPRADALSGVTIESAEQPLVVAPTSDALIARIHEDQHLPERRDRIRRLSETLVLAHALTAGEKGLVISAAKDCRAFYGIETPTVREMVNEAGRLYRARVRESRRSQFAAEAQTRGDAVVRPLTEAIDTEEFPDLKLSPGGDSATLKATIENFNVILQGYGIGCSYDVITKRPLVRIPGYDLAGNDGEVTIVYDRVASQAALCGYPNSGKQVFERLNASCYANPVNPVVEYLESCAERLPWQSSTGAIQRLADLVGVPEDQAPFRDYLLRKFLVMCCAAADGAERTPNKRAKPTYEYILEFVGGQGGSKTTFFEELMPPHLSEYQKDGVQLNPKDKDSVSAATSAWIVELGEMDGMLKSVDHSLIKAFMSHPWDEYRKPYASTHDRFRRRCVFCGSVNTTVHLRDPTGNRRHWPISVTRISRVTDVGLDMDEVWAEAFHLYMAGEQWWPEPEWEAALDSHRRRFEDPTVTEIPPEAERILMVFGDFSAAHKALPGAEWMSVQEIMGAAGMVPGTYKREATISVVNWLSRANVRADGTPDIRLSPDNGRREWLMPPRLSSVRVV